MYVVDLQYFDGGGRLLGTGHLLSPGKDPRALVEYVRKQDTQEFCGLKPAFIHACPETGEPVLIRLGG